MSDFKNQKNFYISLAILLCSITAISISLTVFKLISDPFLAIVFAGAAIGLDIFKYVSWPLIIRLLRARKRVLAASLAVCALTLAGISGWASYDRMSASIAGDNAQIRALKGERLDLLRSQIDADMLVLAATGGVVPVDTSEQQRKTLVNLHKQAAELRARGMPTKAVEFEASTIANAEKRLAEIVASDNQRFEAASSRLQAEKSEARARVDKNSAEALEIEALVEKGASISPFLILLVCAGFAIGLEVFPSLILASIAALETEPDTTVEARHDEVPQNALEAPQEPVEPITQPTPLVVTKGVEDELLMNQLLASIEPLKSGDPVKIKDFAVAAKIGTMRACELFKLVAKAGIIEKTGNGYKKSLKNLKRSVA
jgi:hypothetical protein